MNDPKHFWVVIGTALSMNTPVHILVKSRKETTALCTVFAYHPLVTVHITVKDLLASLQQYEA